MADDSDEEFARFLELDDSASASSASPVKTKRASKKEETKTTKSRASTKTTSAKSSSTRAASSSLSVVAAAERLLAASGRGKKKSQVVEEAEEEEGEEPPPSYSADPYTFELGASYHLPNDSDEDEDDKKKMKKTKKESKKTSKERESDKKSKKQEAAPVKREAKSALSLDQRIADILKRTGSSNFLAADEKDEGSTDPNDIDVKKDEDDRDSAPSAMDNTNSGVIRGESKEDGANDDDDEAKDSSSSDSLGMESADFEVGVHARRKLDRSRLSLSSLNSVKFAVNIDALEDSELASHPRYGQQNETPHIESEVTDSDYADDGFELDQTTSGIGAIESTATSTEKYEVTSEQDSSFVSEFEKMKGLFSIDSPPPAASSPQFTVATDLEKHAPLATTQDSHNFGYDDDDFEDEGSRNDEATPIATQASFESAYNLDPAPDYGDDEFEEELSAPDLTILPPAEVNDLRVPVSHAVETMCEAPIEMTQQNEVNEEVLSTDFFARAGTSMTVQELGSEISMDQPDVTRSQPRRSLSPPPPPPPDDDEDEEATGEVNAPRLSAPLPITVVPITREPAEPRDRFHQLDTRVSSLRFLSTVAVNTNTRANIELTEDDPSLQDEEIVAEMKEIEDLMEQARQSRDARHRRLPVRSSSSKESELALRLQQAKRQILQFKQHVKQLVSEEDNPPSDPVNPPYGVVDDQEDLSVEVPCTTEGKPGHRQHANKEENLRLRKEIEIQERLIQGFQRENEQLMQQLKQIQRDVKYDVHKENEMLKRELKSIREGREGTHPHVSSDDIQDKFSYHASVEARLQAEAQVIALKEELTTQRLRFQAKISELAIELEKVKKAKIEVECRYEGVDLEKVESETRHVKRLEHDLQLQRTEHEHTVASLKKKLDWYMENQRLLDEQDERMSALRAENKALKSELRTYQSSALSSTASNPATPAKPSVVGKANRSAADIRKIRELEARVGDLEEALRKRHPDSLVSLIAVSRKSEEESRIHQMQEEHERRVAELEEELEILQLSNEKKLKSFRQQQEKLVHQFQKHISVLESRLEQQQSRRAAVMKSTRKAQTPPSDSNESELGRVRQFYAGKIKELERKWEAKYRSLRTQNAASTPTRPGGSVAELHTAGSDASKTISALQSQLRAKESELARLRSLSRTASEALDSRSLLDRTAVLENQLKASESARRHLVDTLNSLQGLTPPKTSTNREDVEGQIQAMRQKVELEQKAIYEDQLARLRTDYGNQLEREKEAAASLKQKLLSQTETTQSTQDQLDRNIKELERLQRELQEGDKQKRELLELVARVPGLEAEIVKLTDKLAIPQTPSMIQFRSLELKIETLTQKHQLREAELKMLLAQASQSVQLERLNWEKRYHTAMAIKNAEIKRFKQQLDEILEELEQLRESSAASFVAR
ncbi:hypothetical protein Poli38472_006086 [Pythium oligandrum]|uniref:Centrosomal protein of 162 kDa n=1 Tax=Pythium oligandrum TaxID=41045 RepID=A0A8K1CUR1_PYTOL|nr:hypothetical protein Poli38472_006086 [Pythium oligandrum]|eukprot:TMW68618.1 hypothetical protein Poli38472_006086 [Pythium oligandrum]